MVAAVCIVTTARIYGALQEALLHEARRRMTQLELKGALFFASAAHQADAA